jgi:hypothetical protein
MRVRVDFQDEGLDFELPAERLVAAWGGPRGVGPSQQIVVIREALEQPRDYPPLRQIVVPGDQVVIALDPTTPEASLVLDALGHVFAEAGIEPGSLTVLTPPNVAATSSTIPAREGTLVVHDRDDRAQLAYLASTKHGRRIYLNRLLTDADVVVPVGRLGFDPVLGYRGPWSVLFPELSDRDTLRALGDRLTDSNGDVPVGKARAQLEEAFEVSWLLGTQLHAGLLPGATGLLEAVVGRDTSVRDQGIAALEHHWRFRAPARAELVVAGVGRPGTATTLQDLADALSTATRLVQHGGKIVVLSHASGTIGPSLQRVIDAGDPKNAATALRGLEEAEDYPAARSLARALAWADVFLYSQLDPQIVEDLSLVALERPEQTRRLVAGSRSATFVCHAELTRADVSSAEDA